MVQQLMTEHEVNQMNELACYAFNSTHSATQKEAYKKLHEHSDNYGIVTEDGLQSQIVSYPFTVMINGVPMLMAGIGDVSTYPEARGQGSVRKLLMHIFKELHEKKVPLSYLAPFSQPFYRQFGYERVFDGLEITIPKQVMTDFPMEKRGKVIRTSLDKEGIREVIDKLYSDTQGKEHGSLVREDWWTVYKHASRQNHRLGLVLDDDNIPRGYIVYEMADTVYHIKEFVYTNYFGLTKLLTFIGSHGSSFETFKSTNILDTSWLNVLPDTSEIEIKSYSYMMARIIDIVTLIEQYPFFSQAESKEMSLSIKDEQCPWNNGMFHVVIEQGRGKCVPTSKVSKTHYEGSIQVWTQIFMHHATIKETVFNGSLSMDGDDELSALLGSELPHLYDYF